jgi:glycosyltransferase involved in cell wall biosynthesis
LEIIIVGDACTDETPERIRKLNDSRIIFHNLKERGPYPADPKIRWYVAGTPPINHAISMAKGQWIAHLDDDEFWMPHHIEKLLHFATSGHFEFVYSSSLYESRQGEWIVRGKPDLNQKQLSIPHSTVMFRSYLKFFEYDINAWKIRLGGDYHLFRRMILTGVRIGFLNELTASAPLRPNVSMSGQNAEDGKE